MGKLVPALVAGAAVMLTVVALAPAATPETYKISVSLSPKAEVPTPKAPAGAKGTFTASYVENSKGAVLKWQLAFSGLSGAATAAHIHQAKTGVAGAVIVPLCGPCKSGMKGTANISKKTVSALESGGTYVNVHTAKNPGGEVRAQIKVSG